MSTLLELLPGFVLNLVMATLVIGFIYYPNHRSKQQYVFTFYTFNILIYFISGLLRDVQLTVGIGFGLLAVFSTLRYRTEMVPVKEMTYLFVSIAFPFMNTLFMLTRIGFAELVLVDLIIVGAMFVLERRWGVHYLGEKQILYEKIELVKPEYYGVMLQDLRERTGLDVRSFDILEVDYLRDTARLMIYFEPPPDSHKR